MPVNKKNEPQLSAEMEKRLENWWMDNDPLDFGQLSAFLATALEEQKQGYEKWANEKIAKCERLKESNFVNESPDYFRGKIAILNDLLAILNGKE